MRESAPAHDRLLALIDDFAGIRVAVFGDLLADEFIYGQIARVSREAPVLILDYDSTEIVPGGAGNAANNVAALGGTPSAIGVVGRDETGRRLLEALGRGVERFAGSCGRAAIERRSRRASSPAASTRRSSRSCASIAPSARSSPPQIGARSRRGCVWAAARCDALLVSDYGTGLVTPAAVRRGQPALCRARPAGAGARRLALRAAPVPRPDGLHAERVGSRAAARHPIGDNAARAREGRARAAGADAERRRC